MGSGPRECHVRHLLTRNGVACCSHNHDGPLKPLKAPDGIHNDPAVDGSITPCSPEPPETLTRSEFPDGLLPRNKNGDFLLADTLARYQTGDVRQNAPSDLFVRTNSYPLDVNAFRP